MCSSSIWSLSLSPPITIVLACRLPHPSHLPSSSLLALILAVAVGLTLALQSCHRRPRATPSFSSLPSSSPSPVSSRPRRHRTRCRSLLTQPSARLTVALASHFIPTLAPCITPGLALGRMRALTASFSHIPFDSLLASARTAANSIYYLPQLHAALDL